MNETQEIRFDKETSEKLDTLIECFQLVLEQIHVKTHTDIHMMKRQIRKELLEEIIVSSKILEEIKPHETI
jgi:hypothetical protein